MLDAIEALLPRRLLIWDPMRQFHKAARTVSTSGALVAALQKKPAEFRYALSTQADVTQWPAQFDVLCRVAYALGDLVLAADELADVTKPGWAPAGWSVVSRRGRHQKIITFGASQRPADMDKTFLGNCSRIRCYRLSDTNAIKTMAGALDLPPDELRALVGHAWIERDMTTGTISRGP